MTEREYSASGTRAEVFVVFQSMVVGSGVDMVEGSKSVFPREDEDAEGKH